MSYFEVDREQGFISDPERDEDKDISLMLYLNVLVGKGPASWWDSSA